MTDALTIPRQRPPPPGCAPPTSRRLGLPRPTAQQVAIIESPLAPALVVAGAGSGKTETMANRVLWLLANGQVRPGEVLGLTFTRKAAGELSARIRERIAQLSATACCRASTTTSIRPSVATYNSFANTIYRDNAMLIGREPDGAVLGEASAWQLAERSWCARPTPGCRPSTRASTPSPRRCSRSAAPSSENVADAAIVRAMARDFAHARRASLRRQGRLRGRSSELARTVGALPVLLDLAEQFAPRRCAAASSSTPTRSPWRCRSAAACRRSSPSTGSGSRSVLLDEYQDTSVVQTWLLAELFRGHPVMAVGDPNQSIYGWRGASAANLAQFADQFAPGRRRAALFDLSTSWRNGHGILEVANAPRCAARRPQPGGC